MKKIIFKELNFWRSLTKSSLYKFLRSYLILTERLKMDVVINYSITNILAVDLPFILCFQPNEKTLHSSSQGLRPSSGISPQAVDS